MRNPANQAGNLFRPGLAPPFHHNGNDLLAAGYPKLFSCGRQLNLIQRGWHVVHTKLRRCSLDSHLT